MGLDMYLHARNRGNRHAFAKHAKPEEAIYWRKANAIHGWFDENVADECGIENCKRYAVSRKRAGALLRHYPSKYDMELTVEEGSSRFGDQNNPFGTKNLEDILQGQGHA